MKDINKKATAVDRQSLGEEIANSIIHGLSVLLSIAATVILLVISAKKGSAIHTVSFSIYGSMLILLYMMSVMSHALPPGSGKRFFELMDFSAVYLLIAGTYMPIALIFLKGAWGWAIFGVSWGLAVLGVLFKVFFLGRFDRMATVIYVLMGWLIVIAAQRALETMPAGFIFWLILGGVLYTAGTLFYLNHKIPWHHPVWHLFVMAGSICHFFGFLFHAF